MTDRLDFLAPAGRALLALIFIVSGVTKLGDPAGTAAYIASGGLPGVLVWPTIAVEVLGGLMLLVGWQARLAAAALAVFTLLAGLLYHAVGGDMIGFMKNLSITGGMLMVVVFGAGAYSLDGRGAAAPARA